METPVGSLQFTINGVEYSPHFSQLATETKQFSVDGRFFHEFDLSSYEYPIELECSFELPELFNSDPFSDENLIAFLHSNYRFALAIGFGCDEPQVLPVYMSSRLLLRIVDSNLKKIECRIAWLISPESYSRDTMVELATDSY